MPSSYIPVIVIITNEKSNINYFQILIYYSTFFYAKNLYLKDGVYTLSEDNRFLSSTNEQASF